MLTRILITVALGLLSLAAYQGFTFWSRKRANAVSRVMPNSVSERARIIYFRSDTCTSCATQSRLFEDDVAMSDLIHRVDVDLEPELAQQYGVMTVPTLMVMDAQGMTRNIHYGVVHPRKLKQQLAAMS